MESWGAPQDGDLLAVSVDPLQLRPERVALPGHQDGVTRSADEDLKMCRRKWLRQIVPGAFLQRLDTRCHAGVACHDHDDRVGILLQARDEQLHAWNLRHVEVDQYDVEHARAEKLPSFLAPPADGDVVTFSLQEAGAAFAEGAFIVDDQDTKL